MSTTTGMAGSAKTVKANMSRPSENARGAPSPTARSTTPKAAGNRAGKPGNDDRLLFLMAHCIGADTLVSLTTGERFGGLFAGMTRQSGESRCIIKMAMCVKNADGQTVDECVGAGDDRALSFDMSDVADISVTSVEQKSKPSFRTDVEISGNLAIRERELQPWQPGSESSVDLSLGSSSIGEWNQFAVNEQKYNVKSDYDENMYTTTIDRSGPGFKQREAEAARMAREIERGSENRHVDDRDEEDKYSGVKRALPKASPGAYVPPSRRPMIKEPAAPAAPYDPAIITAQVRKKPDVTEGVAKKVLDEFKQFSNTEKLRVQQQQQVAAERQRSSARQEKSIKLNDLKAFSQSFKLFSRVPDDLVPILAKSKEKQTEIMTKANQQAEVREAERKSQSPRGDLTKDRPSIAAALPTSPSHVRKVTSPPAARPQKTITPSLNVKAMEFRPNPAASTFTPVPAKPSPKKKPASPRPMPFFTDQPIRENGASILAGKFDPVKHLQEQAKREEKTKEYSRNGGIPQAYRTPPTWDCPEANRDRSYADMFPKTMSFVASPARSMTGPAYAPQMAYQHSPRFYPGQDDPRMFQTHMMHQPMHQGPIQHSPMHQSPRMAMAYPQSAYPHSPYAMSPNMRPGYPAGQGYMNPGMPMYGSPVPGHVQPHFAPPPANYGSSPRMHGQPNMYMHGPGNPMMPHHAMRNYNQPQYGSPHVSQHGGFGMNNRNNRQAQNGPPDEGR